jgi:hypothetical protein
MRRWQSLVTCSTPRLIFVEIGKQDFFDVNDIGGKLPAKGRKRRDNKPLILLS